MVDNSGVTVFGSTSRLDEFVGLSSTDAKCLSANLLPPSQENLGRIFAHAIEKLGDRIEQPGAVNPRVLQEIIQQGSCCEDELMAEYYAGIMAASRSIDGRDDSAMVVLALMTKLPAVQVRAHFLIYLLTNQYFSGSKLDLADKDDCKRMELFVPIVTYATAMDFPAVEDERFVLGRTLYWLNKYDLIMDNSTWGASEYVRLRAPRADTEGILVGPSLLGAELFLWGIGYPRATGRELLDIDVTGQELMIVTQGTCPVSKLQ